MNKKEARIYFREKRNGLQHREIQKFQDLMLIRFQQLSLPFISVVHSYLPIDANHEPDPEPLIRHLEFRNPGLCVVSPRITGNQEMEHIVVTEDTGLLVNEWGILEPEGEATMNPDRMDLIFVPLLAYDQQGNRVGYGKGYYDRFLANCRPDAFRVGLSFFGPLEQIEDAQVWDIPLHYCITPEQVYEF